MALTSTRYTAVGVSDTESSYGNETARDRWFKVLSASGFQETVEYMPVATLHQGAGPGLAHSHKGNVSVSGQIVVPFLYAGIGRLLKFCLGAAPSSSGSGPYTHTYNMGATIHSFTMELVRGNSGLSEIFLGCVVTAWEINVEQGQIVSMTINITAQKASAARNTAPTPSFTAFNAANFEDGRRVTAPQVGSLNFDSASYAIHRSLKVSVNRGIEFVRSISSDYVVDPAQTAHARAMIEAERVESSAALYNAHRAGTAGDVGLTLTGASNYDGSVTLRNAKIFAQQASNFAPGTLSEALTFEGFQDDTDNQLTIVLVNDSSSAEAA